MELGELYRSNSSVPMSGSGPVGIHPTNLHADMSEIAGVSVNDLRFAFQFQKMLERDARGGTRYNEIILNHFGVVAPDGRLQRPELLGANRVPIAISQVVQSSGEVGGTQQGNIAGYALNGG
ncbi:MAG: hypothetical protein KFW07_00960, partial [Mycoplasmataceae bacterium]|nr:hypothetical protein [Mycoplasmataceae bacterium]